ncbi:transmembrane protein, putative (macronuclear) [Tetrahymena thermophila SB210]|uniref:Transmembrane protein, putative n=1 Tax=Tetrahymena thermophila (strain SB210) TaxID=312017 RepID=W7XL51_TETTS|nr:transmembrane protein, putative [Tetrahymena thermophila SB210]EWS75679.1 transmembrane protein, putative [Tetrahymena thermophila SB210]|eukprot:XP_012651825.1 transmembrane protein, putative [Tetrahymena thermophila SB210]
MLVTQSKSVQIQNSIFQNNTCLNGGALSLIQCSNTLKIQNSKFQYNEAFASGGAIYFENVDAQIQMDSLVQINKNQALIGGGIRLLNNKLNLLQSLNFNYKNLIFDNSAQLYGKNVGTFLQNATIGVIQDISAQTSDMNQSDQQKIDYKIIKNEEMNKSDQQKFQQILQIFKFQSGGTINLSIQLIDAEGTYLKIEVQKYYSQQYPDPIMDELRQIQFKIQSYTQNQDLFINGHNIITSSDFYDQNNQFIFTQIQISSMPNQTASLQIIPYYIPANINVLPIYIEIHMRICYPGEVVRQLENNIYSCYPCPLGSYSITDPTKDQLWSEKISKTETNTLNTQPQVYQSECKKCPDSAIICQKSTIILKKGYWRNNSTSTDIVECPILFNACDEQDQTSKNGCLSGYMGPICKMCDLGGQLWKGQRFSQSHLGQSKCQLCSDIKYLVFTIILAILLLLFYFIFSMQIFYNSFVNSCICYYLRKINLISISSNSIKDKSSVYMKILVNYVKISSTLVTFQFSFLPDLLLSFSDYLGDPISKISVNISCLISSDYIRQFSQAKKLKLFGIQRQNNLQKCITLYYFGYYYQEFKEKFYYWEFIRIYLRVIIIVAFTLTSQSQFISYQIVIFLLFFYIKFTLYFNPIRNNNLQRFDLFCNKMIILNSLLSIINIDIKSGIISGIIYSLHFIVIFMTILIIIFFKLNNPFTFVGRFFNKFLYKILPRSIYNKYIKIYSSNWQVLTRWKRLQKNLSLIVSLQAIEKVTQQKCQPNSNQVNIDLDPLIKTKSDIIKTKLSNINKQSSKRSTLYELSKFKDLTPGIIKLEREQSETPFQKYLELIDIPKKDRIGQNLEEMILQQGVNSDELNFKSEIFSNYGQKKIVDEVYDARFNRKKNYDSFQQFQSSSGIN